MFYWVHDVLRNRCNSSEVPNPSERGVSVNLKTKTRNLYQDYFSPEKGVSGDVCTRAIVLLERAGFMVDTNLLNSKCATARDDERRLLSELQSDYKNICSARSKGESDEGIAKKWSSPTQLVELIHTDLGLPPSPIYKKGQVAVWKGEVKLDGVALDYLGNANPVYRQFLHRIRNLRTTRGSIKYLSKLPRFVASDGFIHPTYGAMGDEDDRSGTATGRLGMKNPEGHQIPNDPSKDPYNIRECFVAPPGMVLVVRDYQAMEVVILAHLCKVLFGDESLYKAVEMGSTFHNKNALNVFGHRLDWKTPEGVPVKNFQLKDFKTHPYLSKLRGDAKAVWYGAQYRKTGRGFGFTLLDSNGEPIGEEKGQLVLEAFLEEEPALQRWYDFGDNWLKKYDYMPSPGGRLRYFSDLLISQRMNDKLDWKFRSAARKAGNHPIQGMGAEIKMAAIWACLENPTLKKLGAVLEKEIHDELHWRVSTDSAEEVNSVAGRVMEEAYPLRGLTTSGGIGLNWSSAK